MRSPGGICPLCHRLTRTLEAHHVCYKPVRTILICHDCHFKIHHYPGALPINILLMLQKLRGPDCLEFKY